MPLYFSQGLEGKRFSPLIRYYVDYFADIAGTRKRVNRSTLDALLSYPYPGNVRELINICGHAIVMPETEVVDRLDLPKNVVGSRSDSSTFDSGWPAEMTLKQILESVERKVMLQTEKNIIQSRYLIYKRHYDWIYSVMHKGFFFLYPHPELYQSSLKFCS